MTATRDAREIRSFCEETLERFKPEDMAHQLAKEHLALLERCRRLEAVFHAADRVYCTGGVHVDGVVNLEEMFEALSVFRDSEAKT